MRANMINTFLIQNKKGDRIMKYLILMCSLCLLTSCQAVSQRVAGEFSQFKQSISEDFDRSTFMSIQSKLAKSDFVGALDKIEKLRSDELKLQAYLDAATDLVFSPDLHEKHLKELHFALAQYKAHIPGPEKGDLHFHNRIMHCELEFKNQPDLAITLIDKINEDVAEFSDPYIRAKYQTRICMKQAEIFQDLEKALLAAKEAEKSIAQVESPEKRSELLINLIDKDLSIFKDVKTANRLIGYLEKSISYINYESDKKEQEASFRKIKNKHNLLLCEFEE